MPTPTSDVEPFPDLDPSQQQQPQRAHDGIVNRPAASSSLSSRIRGLSETFEHSHPPEGFFAATSDIASSIVELPATAAATAKPDGAGSPTSHHHPSTSPPTPQTHHNADSPSVSEKAHAAHAHDVDATSSRPVTATRSADEPPGTAPFTNGYHFPPKHSFAHSTKLGAVAFWNYFLTPLGFCVTIYGLNVVAWGGMLFLLLCNACKCTFTAQASATDG
jgi:hypothetical protein